MWPVVRSADRHAELGAVPVTPSVHPRSLQSPQDFYTARSHLLAHEIVPVACSASSSTSSWSPSSCDSLMAGDQHKVVSDRSASGQSEHSCSVKEPSLVDMRHEVPSVSLERRHVVFTPKAQQVTALTGPVKSTSTAQEFSKVYNYCASFPLHSIFTLQRLLGMLLSAGIACVHGLYCSCLLLAASAASQSVLQRYRQCCILPGQPSIMLGFSSN